MLSSKAGLLFHLQAKEITLRVMVCSKRGQLHDQVKEGLYILYSSHWVQSKGCCRAEGATSQEITAEASRYGNADAALVLSIHAHSTPPAHIKLLDSIGRIGLACCAHLLVAS